MTHSGHEAESMTNNNWDGWLQISSTLAVLFGIALVVFELQQNSDLIELQIVKDYEKTPQSWRIHSVTYTWR